MLGPTTQREKPRDCSVEPPYPGAEHMVTFSVRAPEMAGHLKHVDCAEEYPHLISECRMFLKGGS